ncbi:hypothetical protein IEQ34_006282 [Dendrobium chrysotoxum]|uniref:C2H2-type domain-containing protein n=1 Tax=Dendrobium chrysotoxum TaxID=161865 RepID=A0AAV7HDM9_DENCH|nr:hypothetical protein IEQ34_006282 [Dendrobium chrysotoxum]
MSASEASKVHLVVAKGILCLACLEESNRVKRLHDSSDMKSPYSHHKKQYKYCCHQCGNPFQRKAQLAIHEEDHN